MASFQANIGWERPRKREKNWKKIENTIIGSFQDKISWKMPRKREKKKNQSDKFLPDPE